MSVICGYSSKSLPNAPSLVQGSACRYSSCIACCTHKHYIYGAYNHLVVVDVSSRKVIAVLLGHGNKITAVAAAHSISPPVALSGSRDRSVVAWNLESLCVLRKRAKLPSEVAAVSTVSCLPSLALIALASGLIASWNWKTGKLYSELPVSFFGIAALATT